MRLRTENHPVINLHDDRTVMVERTRNCSTILAWPIRVAVLCAAFALPAGAAAAGLSGDARAAVDRGREAHRGIVWLVSAKAVVLKELDGSTVTVPVDTKTRVLVDGKPGSLDEVKPGFVAVATWQAGKPARVLRTFDPSPQHGTDAVVVKSVSAIAVVLKEPNGSTVTLLVNAKTRVFVDGKPASLRDVKPGFIVVTRSDRLKGNTAAKELRFRRPR
jgi:hypothetical protein